MRRTVHEMSIAEGILDISLDTMRQHEGTIIHSVQLDVGLMSGVEPDALLFCWDAITQGSSAEGARLDINRIPITGQCLDCNTIFDVQNRIFICPNCESNIINIMGGRELQVTSIDID